MQSTITFNKPVHFTLGWKIVMNIFAALPSLLIYAVVGVGTFAAFVTKSGPLFAIAVALSVFILFLDRFFMPFLQGNFLLPEKFPNRGEGFITQITFTPRRHRGLEGVLDDADDFGMFSVEGDFLVFRGSSTYLAVHKQDIGNIQFENVGWRALWMMGQSAKFFLDQPVCGINDFKVHTREGNTLVNANRTNKAFCDYLGEKFSWDADPRADRPS